MKIMLGFAAIFLLPIYINAQNNADSIKFEIIKETLNFLAADGKVSKDTNLKIECNSQDYNCLEKSLGDKIQGALSRVQKWQKIPTTTSEELQSLKTLILADIIEMKGKEYRKNLPDYTNYINILEQSIELFKDSGENNADAVFSLTVNDNYQNRDGENLDEASNITMEGNLPLISLIASILAILLSIIALLKKPKSQLKEIQLEIQKLNDAKKQIHDLNSKFSKLSTKESLKILEDKLEGLNHRVVEIENKNSNIVEWKIDEKTDIYQDADDSIPPHEVLHVSTTNFAKYPNLENGFSSSILKASQNGEQTYEIEIIGDEATYAVSNDEKAQKYALFNYEYLSNGCEFQNQPEANSRIYTLEKGTLIKSSGNWIIQNRAIIQFR